MHGTSVPPKDTHQMPDSVPGVISQGESQGELCRVDEGWTQAKGFDELQVVSKMSWENESTQAKERDPCRNRHTQKLVLLNRRRIGHPQTH